MEVRCELSPRSRRWGRRYVIDGVVNETIEQVPQALSYIPTPCMVDCVDVISPEGKRLKRISLLEALLDSPYAALFSMLERPKMSAERRLRPARRRSRWTTPSAATCFTPMRLRY